MLKISSTHNPVMDWIRGLASMYVVIFHLNEVIPFNPTYWQCFCKHGCLGVASFFVVSGWCMAMIADRTPKPLYFLQARLARIFLPYWASLGVVLAVVAIRLLFSGVNDVTVLPHSPEAVIAVLSLCTKPVTDFKTINWVYWSLSFEIAFYILIFVGIYLRRSNLILLTCILLLLVKSPILLGSHQFNPLFWTGQYLLFLIGYFGFYSKWSRFEVLAALAIVIVGLYSLSRSEIVVGVSTCIALFLGARHACFFDKMFFSPLLSKLGQWSYSLYLIHVPIGCYLLLRLRTESITSSAWKHPLYDTLVLVGCIAFAAFFYHFVESPAHKLAQFLSKNPITHLPHFFAKTTMP